MRSLIDSHVHMESFEDADSIIEQSKIAGIDAILCVGGSLESSVFTKNLAVVTHCHRFHPRMTDLFR